MTPTFDSVLSAHGEQISSLKDDVVDIRARAKEDREDVRGMRNLLIGTLLTAIITLITVFVKH